MVRPKIYSAYDPPPKVRLRDFGKMITRQSEAAAVDVNRIVGQFVKTGVLPQVQAQALFADVSEMTDYRDALHQVELADKMFMSLPAKVRAKFENDPATFLDFCSDPQNREELEGLGLVEKAPVEPGEPPVAA